MVFGCGFTLWKTAMWKFKLQNRKSAKTFIGIVKYHFINIMMRPLAQEFIRNEIE